MNILDENIPKPQRELLERHRIPVKQIGVGIGRKGLLDEEIISLLQHLRHPTFLLATQTSTSALFATHGTPSSICPSRNPKSLCSCADFFGILTSKHSPAGWVA